ncbi:MAG: 50S ribosomal protein L28 [Elusimicrobiota bacterium]
MSKQCIICSKNTATGNRVSKSNKKTRRKFKANLQKIKIQRGCSKVKAYVCTRCLKTGKVRKAV